MKKLRGGGGWQAIRYSLRMARQIGPLKFWRAMRSKNACKTCALGMGGQLGGMTNEAGHFPEVCKKSMQAMAADMRGRIEPKLFSSYSISHFKTFSSREMEAFGRITDPLMAGPEDRHFRIVTWEEALSHTARALAETAPRRSFFYASGRSSNEAGFLLHLLARSYGTNHLSNCSFYCHQASGVGLKDSVGTGTATVALEDLEKCDLLFLIGGNPASNHPRLMTTLQKIRARGGKIIVVNPAREPGLDQFRVPSNVKSMLFGSQIASTYVQPTIGGDIALFVGIAKRLIAIGSVDDTYIAQATEGYEELRSFVEGVPWEKITASSGVIREQIEAVADEYSRSERTVFSWTMGITHHEHGVQNVQWIANLALMRGMVGREGAGLLPIRGHSNVQGMGTMGVSPAMTTTAIEGLHVLGLSVPEFEGYDTMASMEAAHRGEMDFALCLGGNLFGANPDATFAAAAMAQVKTVVYLSTSLNTGHAYGMGKTTIILPVLVRDEESQSTTQESMFNYMRLSDGGQQRFEGPLSEVEILSEIAHRALGEGGPLDWQKLKSHQAIRSLIARLVPNLEQMETVGQTKQEFHIPGRVLREPVFGTPTGRASFRLHDIPATPPLGEHQLRLMTIRSEGQFNTVVYEEEDLYRGQDRRDVILMNPGDMKRMGFAENQPVNVSSEVGVMPRVLARAFDIAPGCAMMYYPEANALVGRSVDPRSKTPAFKSAVVTVEAAAGSVVSRETLAEGDASSRSRMRAC